MDGGSHKSKEPPQVIFSADMCPFVLKDIRQVTFGIGFRKNDLRAEDPIDRRAFDFPGKVYIFAQGSCVFDLALGPDIKEDQGDNDRKCPDDPDQSRNFEDRAHEVAFEGERRIAHAFGKETFLQSDRETCGD